MKQDDSDSTAKWKRKLQSGWGLVAVRLRVIAVWKRSLHTFIFSRRRCSLRLRTSNGGLMAAQVKKCAHPPCSCMAIEGSKYCSVECEAMEKTPDIECACPHARCKGKIA